MCAGAGSRWHVQVAGTGEVVQISVTRKAVPAVMYPARDGPGTTIPYHDLLLVVVVNISKTFLG